MSTRKFRKALESLKDAVEDHPNSREEHYALVRDALSEVEAIERAAGVVTKDKNDEYVMQGELGSAYGLFASIAKDAP